MQSLKLMLLLPRLAPSPLSAAIFNVFRLACMKTTS